MLMVVIAETEDDLIKRPNEWKGGILAGMFTSFHLGVHLHIACLMPDRCHRASLPVNGIKLYYLVTGTSV